MQLAERPDKLAAGFRKTLSGCRRSTTFYRGREASGFGRVRDGWLDPVTCESGPRTPLPPSRVSRPSSRPVQHGSSTPTTPAAPAARSATPCVRPDAEQLQGERSAFEDGVDAEIAAAA
jgi:hypothetical protein